MAAVASQLELHNVSVHYGDFAAATGVSLTLDAGQIGCLLGPSGCGKTTLLRAIAGFEPVANGAIQLHGKLISAPGFSLPPERRRVGMVFQDFALFPHLNVRRNVAFGLSGLGQRERRKRVEQMLELVDLASQGDSWPHELSGGQQQRVALARALAPQPEILLLDEPFSSLDSELREQLAGEVRNLLKRRNVTAILVTHDQHEAFAMADRVTLLDAGKVAQTDTPYNLYHKPASEFVAGFIGQGSFISVTVGAGGDLPYGLGSLKAYATQWRPGDCLKLLIRPDDVIPRDTGNLRLPVRNRAFRGAEYLYELELPDGQSFSCLAPSHVDVAVGETLAVEFDLQHLVVFRD